MSQRKDHVRRFYTHVWNAHDKTVIAELMHPDVSFRTSLGHIKKGHAGIAEYVDQIHTSLGSYQCIIEDMLAENNQVFARLIFTGIHQGELLGYTPTGQRVNWIAAALFTFEGALIKDIWVLGDLNGLEHELADHSSPS